MEIRLGRQEDVPAVCELYNSVNDALAAGTNYPGWKKGVYPTRADAEAGVVEGCLYVMEEADEIYSTLILRRECEEAYKKVTW